MGNTVRGQVEAANATLAANQIGQMGYALLEMSGPGGSVGGGGGSAGAGAGERPAFPPSQLNQTHAMPPAAPPSNVAITQAMPPATPAITTTTSTSPNTDLLRSDAEARRKVEADLKRLGMSPDEIRRLVEANANTTAAPSGGPSVLAAMPVMPLPDSGKTKLRGAHQKVAARAADLQSFAAQLQSASSANQIQAVEAVSLDLPGFRESTIQERQAAESLLREVYALRKREKYTEAIAKCREALGMVPSDAAALEMFGDLLQGVARTNEAMAAYKRAVEADPKRSSAERKYGDLLVRQQHWVEPDTEEVPKNPIAAGAFSLLIPGAGQIHNGQTLKGAILVGCAIASMIALLFLMRDKVGYATSVNLRPAPATTVKEKRVAIDWVGEAPVMACVLFYTTLSIGSAIDAAAFAHRTRGR